MKEKKQTEIATNLSSGAEKVERIEQTAQEQDGVKTAESVKKTVKTPASKTQVKKKVEKENKDADKRVKIALKKKTEKEKRAKERAKRAKMTVAERKAEAEKRQAERKAKMEKRKAERKARAEKRLAERKARIEKKKAELEAMQRERAHAKANRSQEKSKRKTQKKEKREHRQKGYGGWLAAVISLGAVTLALTTAVTLGAIEMKKMNDATMAGYRATTYEIAGLMENVDNDLDRVRLSTTPAQQDRILTDLLVQARLAELDLEKMPISPEANANVTRFINRVAMESERMLSKLRNGEKLSEKDYEVLQKLYEINHSARMQVNEYIANMQECDMMEFVKKGEGKMQEVLQGLENLTLEENRPMKEGMPPKMEGAGIRRSDDEGSASKLDAKDAEARCSRYFSDYKIQEFQCVGETVTRDYKAFNVQGYDENGTQLFAEIDGNNGTLIRFDYFEPCQESTFDIDNSKKIAEQFLQKLGYEDMTVVRLRENGTDIDFTYAYQTDGVVYYPDSVHIKVCRARGVVTGLDSSKFIKNHKQREEPKTSVTLESAQNALRKGVEVQGSRVAVIQTARGERVAYEFLCSYMDENYFIYTDANTGNELAIVNLKNIG